MSTNHWGMFRKHWFYGPPHDSVGEHGRLRSHALGSSWRSKPYFHSSNSPHIDA